MEEGHACQDAEHRFHEKTPQFVAARAPMWCFRKAGSIPFGTFRAKQPNSLALFGQTHRSAESAMPFPFILTL
jgi:hypothetical protein